MTITRADVAELQPGDVVEMRWSSYPDVFVRGPLHESSLGALYVGWLCIRYGNGGGAAYGDADLTVVSRAPRPLYVNHGRTEPVPGDVVLAPDGNGEMQVWICITYITGQEKPPHFVKPERHGMSHALPNGYPDTRMCQPFRLLVDGETGQVVP